jgi:hypothetical protein
MAPEVTPDQRDAVLEVAKDLDPVVGPLVSGFDIETDETFDDDPEAREGVAAQMGGAITLMTESPVFDCDPVTDLRKMPGVQHISVEGVAKRGGKIGRITCS